MSARQMLWLATLALIAGMLAVSCSSTMTATSSPKTATPAQLAINRPIPESLSTQSSPRVYTEKVNLDAFAPPGRGRDLTIMNCDYCHSWTCALQGQRTVRYWESIKYRHRVGSMVILSDHDWDTLFSYLEDNFNDRNPEPSLPSAYSSVSCDYDTLY